MPDKSYTITWASETSLLVKYHESFSTGLSVYIARCAQAVIDSFPDEILNTVPSYDALLITFQPWATGEYLNKIHDVLSDISRIEMTEYDEIIRIPTYYDHEVAIYLDDILKQIGYKLEELIRQHTAQPYFVYMIGFCPGFAYMGELPKQMHLPRRSVPQLKIPSGSVAIAEFQTAIYPIEMPGGWHIIGRTPLKVFDATRENPSLFKQGNLVQFYSVSRDEYLTAGGVL